MAQLQKIFFFRRGNRTLSNSPRVVLARLRVASEGVVVTSADDLLGPVPDDGLGVSPGPGWRQRARGLWRGPCPACSSRTGGWLVARDDGSARVGCWSCGDWKAVRDALGVTDARRSWRAPRPPHARATDGPRTLDMEADADVLDAVYLVLLSHLEFDDAGRQRVLGDDRGMAASLRDRVGALIGPVPRDRRNWERTRRAIVADLRTVAPFETLARVPELAARANQSLAVLHTRTHARYFEPWRDERGRIVALRAYMGRDAEPKYLATAGRWGPMVHFATGVPRDQIESVPWVFTEGWMKAEVAAHALGCVGVALPGVNSRGSWARALRAKQELAPHAPAVVAFDAEVWTTRPDITVHALDLALAIEHASGRPAEFAVWDAAVDEGGAVTPKGIDDAIVAGVPVRITDRAGFGTYLGPALERWEAGRAAA